MPKKMKLSGVTKQVTADMAIAATATMAKRFQKPFQRICLPWARNRLTPTRNRKVEAMQRA